MDSTTYTITIAFMACIGLFGLLAVGGSMYRILVWYTAYRQRKVDALKSSPRQGTGNPERTLKIIYGSTSAACHSPPLIPRED